MKPYIPLTRLSLLLLLLLPQLLLAANPKVLIETSKGNIEVELFADKAPETVKNFLRYVNEGFYDGTVFHRVIKRFMIQGGGFDKDLNKKTTHEPITNEAENKVKNAIWTIAMARTSAPHSATSQFFINTNNNRFLDFKDKTPRAWGYAVFGVVTSKEGQQAVVKIDQVATGIKKGMRDVPLENVTIKHIKLLSDLPLKAAINKPITIKNEEKK